jgi:hypothetical protein
MFGQFVALARFSLRKPRAAIRDILEMDLDPKQVAQLAVLSIVLLAVTSFLVLNVLVGFFANGNIDNSEATAVLTALGAVSPLSFSISGAVSFVLRGAAIFLVGRQFGGVGTLQQSFLILAWFDLLSGIGILIAVAGMYVFPGLFIFLMMAGGGYLIWVALNFVAELHQFQRLTAVFLGVFVSYFMIEFVISIVVG